MRVLRPYTSPVSSISAGTFKRVGPAYETSSVSGYIEKGALLPDVTLPGYSQSITICNPAIESYLGAAPTKILYVNSFGGTAATQALTFTGVGSATETITIGSRVYTLRASVSTTADDVLIGASSSATAVNLRNAINANGQGGYGTDTTVNTQVWASVSGAVLTITARAGGTAGNSIATTETSAAASWGAATMAGGAAPSAAQTKAGIAVTIDTPLTLSYEGDSIPTLYVHCAEANDFSIFYAGA